MVHSALMHFQPFLWWWRKPMVETIHYCLFTYDFVSVVDPLLPPLLSSDVLFCVLSWWLLVLFKIMSKRLLWKCHTSYPSALWLYSWQTSQTSRFLRACSACWRTLAPLSTAYRALPYKDMYLSTFGLGWVSLTNSTAAVTWVNRKDNKNLNHKETIFFYNFKQKLTACSSLTEVENKIKGRAMGMQPMASSWLSGCEELSFSFARFSANSRT